MDRSEIDRDSLNDDALRAIARLAPIEADPRRAYALVTRGYTSADRIARAGASAFLRDVTPEIDARAAWLAFNRAHAVRSRTVHQWLRVREALSPYQRALSPPGDAASNSTEAPLPIAPGLSVNYKSIFGEAPYADVPHDASILGPGAYFIDLMALVQRAITDANPDRGMLNLAARRPDLWNLLVTLENANERVSNADLALEILESTLAASTPGSGGFLGPATFPGAPPEVRVLSGWPSLLAPLTPGAKCIIDSGGTVVTATDYAITQSVTIRSGCGFQQLQIGSYPVVIAPSSTGAASPTVIIEGLYFTFAAGVANPAASLIQFAGGSLILRNCVFCASGTLQNGWAIALESNTGSVPPSGTIQIENCTFVDPANTSHALIDVSGSGPLTVSLSNSIVLGSGQTQIQIGTSAVLNVTYSDIRGGAGSIVSGQATARAGLNYSETNFDEPPLCMAGSGSSPLSYTVLQRASPCVGRGSNGRDVGARYDIYDALAWALYPYNMPFDLAFESGRKVLDALAIDLDDIAVNGADAMPSVVQSVGFPLSQLGLSLADYLILAATAAPANLDPYFGFAAGSVADAGLRANTIVLEPAAQSGAGFIFPAKAFAAWTDLSLDALRDLVYQDLSHAEIAQGIQAGAGGALASGWAGFYVNGWGDTGCNTLALRTEYVPAGRYALALGNGMGVTFQQLSQPPAGSFTLSFWMYPAGPQGSTAPLLQIGSGTRLLTCQLQGSALLFSAQQGQQTQQESVDLSAFIDNPQWLHWAIVYDAAAQTVTLYVNGQSLRATANTQLAWPAGPICLGAASPSGLGFTGCLCDLTIWNLAPGSAEMAAAFQRPAMTSPATSTNQPPAGLVGYWPLNDNSGSVLDWSSATLPDNGSVVGQPTWQIIGLPQSLAPSAGQTVLLDGLDFIQLELVTGSPAVASATTGQGVTHANLDRISRFLRMLRKTGWSCTELDWALFTGWLRAPSGLEAPQIFAHLANLRFLARQLDTGIINACAFFAPLRPFGRGRNGDQPVLFDQVLNRPPLAAIAFVPNMSLALSITGDFNMPGPIARRLADMLNLEVAQLTKIAQCLASGDALTLNGATLTALYCYRLLAGWAGFDIDAFLNLVDLTSSTAPGPGGFGTLDVNALVRALGWIRGGGHQPTELRYLVSPTDATADFFQKNLEAQFRERLPTSIAALGRGLSACRITPESFVSPLISADRSAAIYAKAVGNSYIDPNTGLVGTALLAQLSTAPYRVPAAYQTINDAVQAAVAALNKGAPAATVSIAAGYYHSTGDYRITAALSSGTLSIQSEGGPNATVIDCGKSGAFISVSGGANAIVVLSGLTLQNGQGTGTAGAGAIYAACAVRVLNCILKNNTGQNGGALCVAGTGSPVIPCEVENCVFLANSAAGNGGALYLTNAAATLLYCTLSGNTAGAKQPNGVYVDAGSSLSINNSVAWDDPQNGVLDWSGSGAVTCAYSDINTLPQTPTPGTHCLSADPLFLDPSQGLVGLSAKSPCIGTAENGATMGYGGGVGDFTLLAMLTPFATAQIAALRAVLADYLGDAQPLDSVLAALGPYQNGLQILTNEGAIGSSNSLVNLRTVFLYLLLCSRFGIDGETLAKMLANPALFSLEGNGVPYQPNVNDLRTLSRLARLRADYPGTQDSLIAFLEAVADQTPARLAALFGWNLNAVTLFLGDATAGSITLSAVLRIATGIRYIGDAQIDAPLFLSLYQNGLIFGADGATPLLETLAGQDDAAAAEVTLAVTGLKRDVLKRFAIAQINAATRPLNFPVRRDDDLSDYLLLDVAMGAQTQTSRIVQATLSLQQFVQRCRLGLEPGITLVAMTEREWNWFDSYRAWEGNRKVFLYPEAYLRPELRNDKTPLFVELERALSSATSTASLQGLYKRYLDKFAVLTGLETVGAWYEPSRSIDSALTATSGNTPAFASGSVSYANNPPYAAQLTLEAWISTNTPVAPPNVINTLLGVRYLNGYSFCLRIDTNGLSFGVGNQGATSEDYVSLPTALVPDSWYHVAGVFDGAAGIIRIYVDGAACAQIATQIPSAGLATGCYTVFGADNSATNAYNGFVNSLAEVRIWSTVRTQAQILANMSKRIPTWYPEFADLCGYWSFEDGDLTDLTGTWNNSIQTPNGGISFSHPANLLDATFQLDAEPARYHLIGRTRAQPYTFYHRIKEQNSAFGAGSDNSVWLPWEEIQFSINASHATPVVSQGRLYVFWLEVREAPANSHATPPVAAHHEVTIKYSWRNADGTWSAPQAPFPKIALPSCIDLDSSPAWKRPCVLPMSYSGATAILVIYGASTPSTAPVCYILNWDQSVTSGHALSSATLDGNGYSLIAPGYQLYPGDNSNQPDSITHGLYVFSGQSILSGQDIDWRIIGFSLPCSYATPPPYFYSFSTNAASNVSIENLGTNMGGPPSDIYPVGVGAIIQHEGAYWAVAALHLKNPHGSYSVAVFSSADSNFANSQVLGIAWPSDWNILPALVQGVYGVSLASWNGSIYAAISSTGDQTIQILRAARATLLSNRPWAAVYTITAAGSIGVAAGGTRLAVGDDGRLHCFYVTSNTVYLASCDDMGRWTSPAATNMVNVTSISEVVLWKGEWYVAVISSGSTNTSNVTLYQTPTLATPLQWTDAPPPGTGNTGLSWTNLAPLVGTSPASFGSGLQSSASLAACASGLVCIVPMSAGAQIYRAAQPDTTGWTQIATSPGYIAPSLTFGRLRATVGTELLGACPTGAAAHPVGNQLSAYVFGASGAQFLLQARNRNVLMNAPVAATLAPDGSIALNVIGVPPNLGGAGFLFERLNSTAAPALIKALDQGGLDGLLSIPAQLIQEQPFGSLGPQGCVSGPRDDNAVHFERSHPFGLYYRELFFFIPWLMARQLGSRRQFREARAFLEYIFKPSAASAGESYWRCTWLQKIDPVSALQALADVDAAALAVYRKDPFDATAVADLRPSAYQRAIVTAYIQTLIDWGDDLFGQNSRESINQAEQLYRYAADLLGPRPRRVAYTPPPPETYSQLSDQVENTFLVSLEPIGSEDGVTAPAPLPEGQDPNGSIADYGLYFGVPDSAEFVSNWDKVEDRLVKIRNGLDIGGAPDDLPLFQPPMSLDEILQAGNRSRAPATSEYQTAANEALRQHFSEFLFSARMIANTVVEFGSSLLRLLEAQDAEGLAELQAAQQTVLCERITAMRTEEVNNTNSTLDSLQATLEAARYRRDYYAGLIKGGVSPLELHGMALGLSALIPRAIAADMNLFAMPAYPVPNIYGLATGGHDIGAMLQANAAGLNDVAMGLSESATIANTMASYARRDQEWTMQKKLAEYDVTQLSAQIEAAKRQKKAMQMQYAADTVTLRNAQAVEAYLRNKFTNAELYGWMVDRLSQLHQQLYQVAASVVQMAQATLSAITGLDQNFISANTWDDRRRGLLAGEGLLLDLARIEQAYLQVQNTLPPEFITKEVSLRSAQPRAFVDLMTTGACTFDLSEEMFDREHPGHYQRLIQSMSIQITGLNPVERSALNGVLTRLSHDYVRQPDGRAVRFLLGSASAVPGRALLRGTRSRRSAITHTPTVEHAAEGPFETAELAAFVGTAAVSRWRLELPPTRNRVDLRAITDVVLRIRYCARYGGDAFRGEVEAALPPYKSSLLLDLSQEANGAIALPAARAKLPRNLPGQHFNARAIYVANLDASAEPAATVQLSDSKAQSVIQLVPVKDGNGRVLGAQFATPLADFFDRDWRLAIPTGHGRDVWALAEFEEAQTKPETPPHA